MATFCGVGNWQRRGKEESARGSLFYPAGGSGHNFCGSGRLYEDTSRLATPSLPAIMYLKIKSPKLHNFPGGDWGRIEDYQAGVCETRHVPWLIPWDQAVAWRAAVAALPANRAISAVGHGTRAGPVMRLRWTIIFISFLRRGHDFALLIPHR
jgi:hypothetical protein